jgi:hypothetical protein
MGMLVAVVSPTSSDAFVTLPPNNCQQLTGNDFL